MGDHNAPRDNGCADSGSRQRDGAGRVGNLEKVMTKQGILIVMEGTDGAGKSEQIARLAECVAEHGRSVMVTREPGGSAIGERIREVIKCPDDRIPMTEMLLFQAARAEVVATIIRPALERGHVVISDRFYASTVAYQGYGAGVPIEDILATTRIATGGLEPDATIWLDIAPDEAERRMANRTEDKDVIERRDDEFKERVRDGYASQMDPTWTRIDASRSREDVAAQIWEVAKQILTIN